MRRNLHKKYEIIELKNKLVQVLNTSAIASGYAGRDPQGGFAIEALRVFIEIVKKISEGSSLFYVMKMKKKV